MIRLQQEVTRKAGSLGYSTENNEHYGSMQITCDGANTCRLYSDDNYPYKDGKHQTEEQEKTFYNVENLIDNCTE